jgi:3-(methylthio)propanoyl-CoA dehydrogenase
LSFRPPIAEQRFVLENVVGIADLAATPRFAAASPDVIDAVLEGVSAFASGAWAPLARSGDTEGAKWTKDGVKMPTGFVRAYRD